MVRRWWFFLAAVFVFVVACGKAAPTIAPTADTQKNNQAGLEATPAAKALLSPTPLLPRHNCPRTFTSPAALLPPSTEHDIASGIAGDIRIQNAFPNLSFERPVRLADASDATGRVWVASQEGQIYVFKNDPTTSSSDTFLDIADIISRTHNEEGLLGFEFDPGFSSNGYFYVYYSATMPRRSVVSRFSVDSANPNRALPESQMILIEIPQPFGNHNGGNLAFGPDGCLYIGLGDGGYGGDPHGNGQNTATLLGSILRIDVSFATAAEPYRVPADNPFVSGSKTKRSEIWAYGLRNPWKFAFDSLMGDLWVADVGENLYEEIDLVVAGGNYGWNTMEGFHCFDEKDINCDQTGLIPPVFEYGRSEGCSISGGDVYRGTRIPSLVGRYVYGDFCTGRVWANLYDGKSVIEHELIAETGFPIVGVDRDSAGELYLLTLNGGIYLIAPVVVEAPGAQSPSQR